MPGRAALSLVNAPRLCASRGVMLVVFPGVWGTVVSAHSSQAREETFTAPPRLTWDVGTVFDFFTSLYVLHKPADFGLRGVWAAGMRSRLPAAEREFLEQYV